MNVQQLLQHFHRISEAPDAIPRLRKFILDLAVRGKLVAQDPNDEPVSILLKRIGVAKSNDEPFPIPTSWAWVPVGQIGDARLGKMLDKAKNKGTPRRYLRNVNVRWFDFDLSDVFEMPFEDAEVDEFALRGGDVLICEGGEPGRAAVWDEREKGIYFQKAIHRVRFTEGVNSHFFVNVIRESADSGRLSVYFTGVGIKHFTGKGLASFIFPLPPLAEQDRIVAKVDELMALCNRLEAAQAERESRRDRLVAATHAGLAELSTPDSESSTFFINHLARLTTSPEHVQQLRQTILNLAVRGKLIPQDPNDEPASELLKRIQGEKERLVEEGKIKKQQPLPPSAKVDASFQLPPGWLLAQVQEIFVSVTDGDHLPPPKTQGGIPFLVIGNVRSQSIDFAGCRHVSEEYYNSLDPIRRPAKGDILYTLVGSYGIPILISDDRAFCVQRHIGILRPSSHVNAQFLTLALESRLVFDQAKECATGIAQKTVPLSGLRRIWIPLPPFAEQRHIVMEVEKLIVVCDRLECQLTTTQTESRRFLEANIVAVM